VSDSHSHRELAVAAFNRSWTLLEAERDEDDDCELLEVAFTSRHHWRAAGGPQQWAISDWMVSRCFAELGDGPMSLRFATSAARRTPEDAPAWLRASLFEGLARAHAVSGNAAARDEAVERAARELELEVDPEERALIAGQLATVPPARD
jgi:hypothetical protein